MGERTKILLWKQEKYQSFAKVGFKVVCSRSSMLTIAMEISGIFGCRKTKTPMVENLHCRRKFNSSREEEAFAVVSNQLQ